MSDKHKRKGKKVKFCCTRGTPCKCVTPHHYQKVCNPGWKGPKGALKYEAHHVLCVSTVKECLAKKRGITQTVKETQWCVNSRTNMVALPLWGHTVKWYHKNDGRPPFANKTQHNWDHNGTGSYRAEVHKSLAKLADEIAESQDEHKDSRVDIKAKLNALSRGYKAKLRARGRRKGGTHKQFNRQSEMKAGKRAGWYQPFSMAASATAKGYPAQNFKEQVKEIVTTFFR